MEKVYYLAIKTIESRQVTFDKTIRILLMIIITLFLIDLIQLIYILS